MFYDSGDKIKKCAYVIFAIGLLASIIGAIALLSTQAIIQALGVLIGGPLVSYLGALLIYGFGDLIENTEVLYRISEKKQVDSIFKDHA